MSKTNDHKDDDDYRVARDYTTFWMQTQITWAVLILAFLVALVTMFGQLNGREAWWPLFAIVFEGLSIAMYYSFRGVARATWAVQQWLPKVDASQKKALPQTWRPFFYKMLFTKDNELRKRILTLLGLINSFVWTLVMAARLSDTGLYPLPSVLSFIVGFIVSAVLIVFIDSQEKDKSKNQQVSLA